MYKSGKQSFDYAGNDCSIERRQAHLPINTDSTKKPSQAQILYFTDPFSPACYAMEQQLRKLSESNGEIVHLEYHMGGLMPLWDLYRNNGISTYADMAWHWKHLGQLYELPINGGVWLVDPPNSSFPSSIAFKTAQIQGRQKSLSFLQRMQEMLFIENKNISKWKYIEAAAIECGLDLVRFKKDQNGPGRKSFEEDLLLTQQLEVMGFPTIIFKAPRQGHQIVLEGYQRLDQLERTLSSTERLLQNH